MHDEVPAVSRESDRSRWQAISQIPRYILGQLAYLSIHGMPAALIGAIFCYAGQLLGRPHSELAVLFAIGAGCWCTYLSFKFEPDHVVERMSKRWDRWAQSGLITKAQLKEFKKELMEWYQKETFRSLPQGGRLPPLTSEPPPNPRPRKK